MILRGFPIHYIPSVNQAPRTCFFPASHGHFALCLGADAADCEMMHPHYVGSAVSPMQTCKSSSIPQSFALLNY